MSNAPSTKLIDRATKESDANEVLGMHAVPRKLPWHLLVIVAVTRRLKVNF